MKNKLNVLLVLLCMTFVLVAAFGCSKKNETAQETAQETSEPGSTDVSEQITVVNGDESDPAGGEDGSSAEGSKDSAQAEEAASGESASQTEITPEEEDEFLTPDISFYHESLTDEMKDYITGVSYPASENQAGMVIGYDDLRLLHVLYYDFNGEVQEGEIICNNKIADDLNEIFEELFEAGYQIEKIRLIDEYGGDDELSMEDNNTSCFNYRVVSGSKNLSKHAYGMAIDINPFYNPYVTGIDTGNIKIEPVGSEKYADRSADFEHKIDEDDLCCKLFKEHGFTWGGDWDNRKDYQHFQKTP